MKIAEYSGKNVTNPEPTFEYDSFFTIIFQRDTEALEKSSEETPQEITEVGGQKDDQIEIGGQVGGQTDNQIEIGGQKKVRRWP